MLKIVTVGLVFASIQCFAQPPGPEEEEAVAAAFRPLEGVLEEPFEHPYVPVNTEYVPEPFNFRFDQLEPEFPAPPRAEEDFAVHYSPDFDAVAAPGSAAVNKRGIDFLNKPPGDLKRARRADDPEDVDSDDENEGMSSQGVPNRFPRKITAHIKPPLKPVIERGYAYGLKK